MNRIIIDTNIYIDYFNSGEHAQIIYQERYPQVIHVSSIVLKDRVTAEWKYRVRGETVEGDKIEVIVKLSPTGKLVVITVYKL